ncbi:RNA-binding protein with serine-rich domain 1 [Saccharothrix sp. S26]|uniref:RNA-binding protein with serine-rich domain 1 n=1 Tax=Saccharothrix sp. S26 TaxID=2907215 RepID=UPI001F2A3247|nr:RNA-binding protein with serine-rich domain 1 [Saccharothrix sp. S26]MCE6995556.1 RNA-binding protein with serine-rich domain 1 [Saccharothrix sp. S26]
MTTQERLSVGHVTAAAALTTVGWVLRAAGVVLFIGAFVLSRQNLSVWLDDPDLGWPTTILLKIVTAVVGGVVFEIGHLSVVWGKRFRTRPMTSFDALPGTRYVLYLRSFHTDTALATPPELPGNPVGTLLSRRGLTREEHLIRYFGTYGQVVAIGRPGERAPQLGALRGYVTGPDWQRTVTDLIRHAHLVVLSATPTPGTVWEFVECLHTIASPQRLVLLLSDSPTDYTAFRTAVTREYATRTKPDRPPLPALPDYTPLNPDPDPNHPVRALITFDHRWQPTLTRFHPIGKKDAGTIWQRDRLADHQLNEALAPQKQLPPLTP